MGDALGRPRALDAARRVARLPIAGRRHAGALRARGEPGAHGERPSSVGGQPARAPVTRRGDGAAVSGRVAIRSCGAVVANTEFATARLADRRKWCAHGRSVRSRSASEALALRGRSARLSGRPLRRHRDAASPVWADLANLSARASRAADAGAADRIDGIGAGANSAGAVEAPQTGGFGRRAPRGPAYGRRRTIVRELAIRDAGFIEGDVRIDRGELALKGRSGDALIGARPGIVSGEA
jgi:hypothetical protein